MCFTIMINLIEKSLHKLTHYSSPKYNEHRHIKVLIFINLTERREAMQKVVEWIWNLIIFSKRHYSLISHRLNWLIQNRNIYLFTGTGVLGTWYIRPGREMLETWHQRHRCYKNIEKSSIVCTTGPNWSIYTVSIKPGECGRIQFRTCVRMLSAQESHVSRIWNAGAEFVWLPQAK